MKQPAIIPPPQHLALIATLAIHPTLTTRAKSLDRIQVANLALQYLQLVLHHVGPLPGILSEAFTFSRRATVSRRGANTRRRTTGGGATPPDSKSDGIDTELANAGSIWAQAENFWHVAGWSFNCSVLHQRRWHRWSAWLAFIIGLLEADWEARSGSLDEGVKEASLIVKYVNSVAGTTGKERKILRAILADGRSKSVTEFGEIWPNETKVLIKDGDVKKAQANIDIEADNYGDYMEDENEEDLEDCAPESSPPPDDIGLRSGSPISDVAKNLGGLEAMNLRIRLLSLLSKVSYEIPEAFTDITTLYHIFFEHIRPLPIPAFFAFMSPSGLRPFAPTAASTLTQYILRSIIATAAPQPRNDDISQDNLEASYLPFAANRNSMIDNTKVSLCVETLVRLLNKHVGLEWTQNLHDLTEAGIKARATKAKGKQTKKTMNGEGACDGTWLTASAERIRMVVEMTRPIE